MHTGTLANFVSACDQQQQIDESVIGEALDAQGWEAVLDEAERDALLRLLGNHFHELHPTLPAFLRRQLLSAASEDGLRQLNVEFLKFYANWAAHFFEDVKKSDPNVLKAVTIEEENLLRALRLAEMGKRWEAAQAIAQTVFNFYEARGRTDEWRALRSHLMDRVGRGTPANADRDQANLWMFLLGQEASDNLGRDNLASAEDAYRRIVNYLISLGEPAAGPIATVYHRLGIIARERQQLDQAEQWCRKALEIRERLGHPPLMVNTLAQLGVLRRSQDRLDEAVSWFGKAWAIASEYQMRVGLQILIDLAHLMRAMGEARFTVAWQQAFENQESPLTILREVLKRIDEGDI